MTKPKKGEGGLADELAQWLDSLGTTDPLGTTDDSLGPKRKPMTAAGTGDVTLTERDINEFTDSMDLTLNGKNSPES